MKTFKQFKAQLNEVKSKEYWNVEETIEDLSDSSNVPPKRAKVAKNASIGVYTITSMFKTSNGPVPMLKSFAKTNEVSTIDVKKGQTIIVIEGGTGMFKNTVIGFDEGVDYYPNQFWKASLSEFKRRVGIK